MPTQDASAFTRKVKMNAIQSRGDTGLKVYTRLYQYVPRSTSINDFLPTFSNKSAQPLTLAPEGHPIPSRNFVYVRKPRLK
jgi:hypothetical protein